MKLLNDIKIQFLPHREYIVSVTGINWLMLLKGKIAVSCENHTEHTNTLCGQNVEFWNVKADGTYRTTEL
jgi:hypothetical protein